MNATEARAAVADARRNEDETVTLHAIEGGGHVYPYPAETIHVTPSEAIALLQYEPAAFKLDSHKREERPSTRPKKSASRKNGGPVRSARFLVGEDGPERVFSPPEAPVEAPEQPEGPTEQVGSSDSSQEAAS